MELYQAEQMAKALMTEHGLTDWTFRFDRAKRRFGICNYTHQTIGLSAPATRINGEDVVRDTILHEIAHAIAGKSAGHGYRWQAVCRQIGAEPTRCVDTDTANVPPAKYVGTCPKCAKEFMRHRLSESLKKGAWCPCTGKSYEPSLAITWRENRIMARGA